MAAEQETERTLKQRILKFLRDQVWQFVGAILGLIAILIAIYLFNLDRQSKQLRVMVLAKSPLATVSPEVASVIEILYKGSKVENAVLVLVRLENTGNQPIEATDYSRPISFSFGPNVQGIEIEIIGTRPANIDMDYTYEWDPPGATPGDPGTSYAIRLDPVLLNPGDSVDMRFILVGDQPLDDLVLFEVDGRISGVKQIEVASLAEQVSDIHLGVVILLVVLLSIIVYLILFLTIMRSRRVARFEYEYWVETLKRNNEQLNELRSELMSVVQRQQELNATRLEKLAERLLNMADSDEGR